MKQLRKEFPKLDMLRVVIEQFAHPPQNPEECIFAQTTQTLSADRGTKITPCQFGGTPDCSSLRMLRVDGCQRWSAQTGRLPCCRHDFKTSVKIGRNNAKAQGQD